MLSEHELRISADRRRKEFGKPNPVLMKITLSIQPKLVAMRTSDISLVITKIKSVLRKIKHLSARVF